MNGFDINSENGTIPENVFCVTFKEEEAGYLAGYAAVKDGFVKRGDTTIITSGIKLQSKTSVGNNTNMIRVYKI